MKTRSATIVRNEEGMQYKIIVTLNPFEYKGDSTDYRVDVYEKQKYKQEQYKNLRKRLNFYDKLLKSPEEQERSAIDLFLQYVSIEDIEKTKLNLWRSLKPKQITIIKE